MLELEYHTSAPTTCTFADGTVKPLLPCVDSVDSVGKLTSEDRWPRKPTKFQRAFAYCHDRPPTVGEVLFAVHGPGACYCWPIGGGAYRSVLLAHGEPFGPDCIVLRAFHLDGRMRVTRLGTEFGDINLCIGPSALLMWLDTLMLFDHSLFERGPSPCPAVMKAVVKFAGVLGRTRHWAPGGRGYKRSRDELECVAQA
jgi:hypothetical protein